MVGRCTGRPELFALKWPNDVLLSRRARLAGILLEFGPAGGRLWLAVGIGVNLADGAGADVERRRRRCAGQPARGDRPPAPPEDFLDLLAAAVDAWEARCGDARASRRSAPPGWRARRASARR